ncbi:MAG: DHA2 family efflux MFS transporter permease subunit [Pseudomonadota bacterium]|nr:DHA2 family efflux MFS transporter permease subunit [Pseudomonadota bacterium]
MIADLPPDERSKAFKRNMVTASVMMATTVVIIDMTIATIALPHMQGGLSASQDQVSWVMTTYFMMQAITMSATGWLAGRFGRKKLYILSLIGFAICSVLSGNATSIEEIMIYRGLQGMFSAPVVPISQALMLDSYPRERHAQAMSIWGMGVMFAPVMGPVIGGWLTDEYSWRWVFYVSMPFSLLGILGAIFFIRETPKNLERRFDIFGFIALAIALAATQFMLDRGEGEGWFGSDLIVATAVIIGLALYLFVAHSTTTKNPFITPAILTDRNYMLGLFFMFLLGILVLSMNVIMPLFLQNARGYPILTAALVMMPRGLGSLFGLILAGKLSGRMDPRLQIAIGFASTAYSAWLFSTFTTDVGIWMFVFAAFFNGIGIGLIFVPLTAVSFWTLAEHLRTEASTFTSLFRNYGSGIGVSIVISVLSRTQSTSHAYLSERTNPYNEVMQPPYLPSQWDIFTVDGLRLLDAEIARQAMAIGFLNDFKLIFIGAVISVPLVVLLSRGRSKEAG